MRELGARYIPSKKSTEAKPTKTTKKVNRILPLFKIYQVYFSVQNSYLQKVTKKLPSSKIDLKGRKEKEENEDMWQLRSRHIPSKKSTELSLVNNPSKPNQPKQPKQSTETYPFIKSTRQISVCRIHIFKKSPKGWIF